MICLPERSQKDTVFLEYRKFHKFSIALVIKGKIKDIAPVAQWLELLFRTR